MNRSNDINRVLDQAMRDAYQRGWDDAVKSFERAAKNAISNIEHIVPLSHGGSNSPENFRLVSPDENVEKPNSSEAEVLRMILALPGHTGAFIANQLPHVHERTVRTGLRRLRLKGLIEKLNSGWFEKVSCGGAPS
jgi:hypothetical protein